MIIPPENCPSCHSVLEWSNDQIYCRNPDCPAKSYKQIEHFAKALKIKGLGPAAIEKLDITTINDIYDLTVEFMSMQLGSEKTAIKLFNEIEKSKKEPLNTLLPAFGIPLVGNSATEKLSRVATFIFDIDEQTCKRAGLGNVATNNLINWLNNSFERYCDLPFSFEFERTAIKAGETICISGKLKSFATKQVAKQALEAKGHNVKDSLTKDVTILVNESGVPSAKTIKAEQLGIKIVTNLKEYLEN